VTADLGGVSDNPLLFPDDDLVAHCGNFRGQPASFAAAVLAMVTASIGNLAERQLDLLVDPVRNGGLPPMLAAGPGRQHGLQGVQLASTALIAEIRRDAMPASMQSLPTNLHNQDVIPLGTQAGLRALDQARLLRLISINKPHTGSDDPEENLRLDWNSLLSDDPSLLFTSYTERYFPPAEVLVDYLADFAAKTGVRVRYDSAVTRVSKRDGLFTVVA